MTSLISPFMYPPPHFFPAWSFFSFLQTSHSHLTRYPLSKTCKQKLQESLCLNFQNCAVNYKCEPLTLVAYRFPNLNCWPLFYGHTSPHHLYSPPSHLSLSTYSIHCHSFWNLSVFHSSSKALCWYCTIHHHIQTFEVWKTVFIIPVFTYDETEAVTG